MDNRINDDVLSRILGSDSCTVPTCNAEHEKSEHRHSWGLKNYPLAMVYAVDQCFDEIYDLEHALEAGTVFKELDLPFMGMTVTKGGNCRG